MEEEGFCQHFQSKTLIHMQSKLNPSSQASQVGTFVSSFSSKLTLRVRRVCEKGTVTDQTEPVNTKLVNLAEAKSPKVNDTNDNI